MSEREQWLNDTPWAPSQKYEFDRPGTADKEFAKFSVRGVVSLVNKPGISKNADPHGLLLITGSTNSANSKCARGLAWQRMNASIRSQREHLVTYEDPSGRKFHPGSNPRRLRRDSTLCSSFSRQAGRAIATGPVPAESDLPEKFVYCPNAEKSTMPTNSVVLITGASTGFGRAAAETLAARGYTVLASMRDTSGKNAPHRDALRSLASRERWALHVIDLDVTQDASVDGAIQEALSNFGHIDVVINNAGIAALGVTEAYTIEQFQQLFNVNLFGVVRVNRAVIPSMRRKRAGLLIHVSSGAGRATVPYMGVYCASKFALEALADAYRFELSPFGIDSVVVEPGIHRTPILENFISPLDQSCVTSYGSMAEYGARVKGVFDAANRAPETPGTEEVVDAFVNLIEMPAGERPFRTVPTLPLKPLLDPYNAHAAEMRQVVASMFGVPELTVLQRSASTAD